MKISIIGTTGIPACYGGFETFAENLVRYKSSDIEYTVFCSTKLYCKRLKEYLGAKLKYINLKANGISSILYDLICMLSSLDSDIMLVLGVSGSIFLPLVCLLYQGKIITNTDGLEWTRGKWNALTRFYLRISEKMAIAYSHIIIGDNQGIVDYVIHKYKKKMLLIEYGANHIQKNENRNVYEKPFCFSKLKYAISVCRIESENNIHLILEAFIGQNEIPLVLVGNWKNSKYGLDLLRKYSHFNHLYLLDPIYDPEKISFLRSNAYLYIHGHSTGGTNPSLVEAMYLGLPVFAFNCVYNRYTTEDQCQYWSNSHELYALLIQSNELNSNDNRKKMKLIADKKYKWEIITSKYEEVFRGCAYGKQ